MIETVCSILNDIKPYCFTFDFENNTIQRCNGSDSICVRDLILITNKLEKHNISYSVAYDKSIILDDVQD